MIASFLLINKNILTSGISILSGVWPLTEDLQKYNSYETFGDYDNNRYVHYIFQLSATNTQSTSRDIFSVKISTV